MAPPASVVRRLDGGTQQALRRGNQRLLVERLLTAGPTGMTRPDVARHLALTPQAVANLVDDGLTWLRVDDQPATRARARGRAGRPPEVLRIPDMIGHVLGIELDHDGIQLALANLYGTVCARSEYVRMPVEQDLHSALADAAQTAQDLLNAHDVAPQSLAAIGVSLAAPMNVPTGGTKAELRLDLGGVRPAGGDWRGLDPAAALVSHLLALPDGESWADVPMHFDNDANLVALAELCIGAASGLGDVIVVHWVSGIGAGLILRGSPFWGAGGIAGELGHVPIDTRNISDDLSHVLDDTTRPRCGRCGRACLEAAIGELLKFDDDGRQMPERTPRDLADVIEAAERGDSEAGKRLLAAARLMGRALAPLVDVLNPAQILISGHFHADAYRRLVPPIQAELETQAVLPAVRDVVVGLGRLGEEAVLHGAVWLALTQERTNYLLTRAPVGGRQPVAA
jgi:predicted NBD/HSP70 family sugar kinase